MPKSRVKGQCRICRDKADIRIDGDPPLLLCARCDLAFFNDLFDNMKKERFDAALSLSRDEKISLGLALNVLAKKYTLDVAKGRQKLKQSEQEGKSQDIYTVLRRRSGSYK
jgi:hypothetical protein